MIIDDASSRSQFSADPYFVRARARSILCLPLVKQATLTGVLYLENSLASHVFTPSRIAVLKLLASQAAISLENAHLYTDLRPSSSVPVGSAKAESNRQSRLDSVERRNYLVKGNVSHLRLRPSDQTYRGNGP